MAARLRESADTPTLMYTPGADSDVSTFVCLGHRLRPTGPQVQTRIRTQNIHNLWMYANACADSRCVRLAVRVSFSPSVSVSVSVCVYACAHTSIVSQRNRRFVLCRLELIPCQTVCKRHGYASMCVHLHCECAKIPDHVTASCRHTSSLQASNSAATEHGSTPAPPNAAGTAPVLCVELCCVCVRARALMCGKEMARTLALHCKERES